MDEGRPTFISLFVFLKSQKCILNVGVIFQESPVTLTFRKIESNLSNAAHSNKKIYKLSDSLQQHLLEIFYWNLIDLLCNTFV